MDYDNPTHDSQGNIVITTPEEVFTRVPRVRTRPHRPNPMDKPPLPDNTVARSNPNFNRTMPPGRPQSSRNVGGVRGNFSSSGKIVLEPPPSPGSARRNRNGNNFSSTLPLNRSRPGSSRTTSTENLLKRTYTLTPELEALKKQALDQEPLEVEDNTVLEDLLLLLSEERRQLAAQHEFKESQRRNEAIGYVMECQTWLHKLEMQKSTMQNYEQRQSEFDQQCEEFDMETRAMRHRMKKKLRHKREKLLDEQEKEVKELEDFWASEPKVRLYNRSSNTLICLRRQLALLLQQCRFDEAADVQAQVDARQKLEETENYNLMQREFNEVFNKMKTRQTEDLQYFDQKAEMEMKKLNRRREKLREALVNREKKIHEQGDLAKDVDKVWNLKQTARINEVTHTKPQMPSLKVSKNDINDKMVQNLSLPPLSYPKYDPKKSGKLEEKSPKPAGAPKSPKK
ncbi:hypothetical protein TRFO_32687 [Tritrichomonas foetus]|uniref:Uncharacterized protein n=1 Tax=Tritrichomonas foetus TaxID=1144522 RepID=A0A1J4JSX9_9EUKA|nr:hypothetical protein TRFO_32687 [Tritrichomonas foetus]|eukprot:OHT00622.1 hypothetical protein TRFO_32687 [Tritrichomonas foetus]